MVGACLITGGSDGEVLPCVERGSYLGCGAAEECHDLGLLAVGTEA